MTAVNHHLADQGARLSALDGRPAFPQFGLPGFGGVPALPAASAPVISEVAAASAESAVAPPPSAPLSSLAVQRSRLPAPLPSTGVPITQINFPHSPSPLPVFSSTGLPYVSAPTSHMSSTPPHIPSAPEVEGVAVPKYHKLTFATYDGKEDPLGWLNKCEQFFRGQMTREVDKVWLASYHLTGVAQ